MATIITAPIVPCPAPAGYSTRGRASSRRGLIFIFIGGIIMIGVVFGIIKGILDAHRDNETKLERRQFQLGGALGGGRDQPVLSMLSLSNAVTNADEKIKALQEPIVGGLQDQVTSFTTVTIGASTDSLSHIVGSTFSAVLRSSAQWESSSTFTTMQVTTIEITTITTQITSFHTFHTFITTVQGTTTAESSVHTPTSSFITTVAPVWKQGPDDEAVIPFLETPGDGAVVIGRPATLESVGEAPGPSSTQPNQPFYLLRQISDGMRYALYPIKLKLRLYFQGGEE